MDLIAHLAIGFGEALTPNNLLYCFVGTLVGTLVGVVPGVGPMATIALLLPVTFTLSPSASLIMLAGIYYGAQYGGSTTAILINMPGESASAITTIDGHQMARQGRAGTALVGAALGSLFAGCVATLVIAAFSIPLTSVALEFGSPEYFSLLVLGLIASVALAHGSAINGIGMILLGLLVGVVGTDIYTGAARFTLGNAELADGLGIVPIAIGIFGVSEILKNLERRSDEIHRVEKITSLWPSWEDLKRMVKPAIRGTSVGCILGVLPGGGAILSSLAAYTIEKKISKTPEKFGRGAIEGVVAPESGNNAGAQTAFIPMLTLGIPSNPLMALMIGALIIQGINPGPSVINEQPALFWGLIVSMWIGNLMLVVLNLPLVGVWVKLLSVPYSYLFPAIMVFACIGSFAVKNSPFDVYVLAIAGAAGYLLLRLRCEPAPLLLGVVLGPMLEEHLRRSMLLSRGDPLVFVQSPISLAFLLLAVGVLVAICLPLIRRRRDEVFAEEG